MLKPMSHYRRKLADKGIREIIAGRWRWYKQAFQMDNWVVGKLVELFGNKITIQGITLSVDNPLITPRYKSSLYFGIYEIPERDLVCRYIDRSLPTIEIGGSIGGVACITNRLLKNPRNHVVVEGSPLNIPTLTTNRDLNNCQFSIEPVAIAYDSENVMFSVANFMWGRIDPSGTKQVSVPATTLRKLLEKYGFNTINLVSDCEGAEIEMVANEPDIFRTRVKCLVLETHEPERGREPTERTMAALEALGFDIQERDEKKDVFAMINRHLA
jgi:FkbM family methyltransferase